MERDNSQGSTLPLEDGWIWKRASMIGTNYTISSHDRYECLVAIKRTLGSLGDDVLDEFRQSCLGHFLQISDNVVRCNKATHWVLTREILKTSDDVDSSEFWFRICDKNVRFSRYEFALVSGLRFGESAFDPNQDQKLRSKHVFARCFNQKKMRLKELLEKFVSMDFGRNPLDYLRVAKVITVVSILFGFDGCHPIQKWVWVLVEDDELWESFPWGSYSFQILSNYLHRIVTVHHPRQLKRDSYHMYGFSLAFMGWIYCAIPQLGKVCGGLISKRLTPRILRFQYKWSNLNADDITVKINRKLKATTEERSTDYWRSVEGDEFLVKYMHVEGKVKKAPTAHARDEIPHESNEESKLRGDPWWDAQAGHYSRGDDNQFVGGSTWGSGCSSWGAGDQFAGGSSWGAGDQFAGGSSWGPAEGQFARGSSWGAGTSWGREGQFHRHDSSSGQFYGPIDPTVVWTHSQMQAFVQETRESAERSAQMAMEASLAAQREAAENTANLAAQTYAEQTKKWLTGFLPSIFGGRQSTGDDGREDIQTPAHGRGTIDTWTGGAFATREIFTHETPSAFFNVPHVTALGDVPVATPLQNFKEIRRRAASAVMKSPFLPYDRRGQDKFDTFLASERKRNVGLHYCVDASFFKQLLNVKEELEEEHIDAYLAILHTSPSFANVRVDNLGIVLTSTKFMTAVRAIYGKYHSLEDNDLLKSDIQKEEIISDEDLRVLAGYVSGESTGWGPCKPWHDYDKLVMLVPQPGHWYTLSVNLELNTMTIWDSTSHNWTHEVKVSRSAFLVPLGRILPQLLKFCGFWEARPNLTPKYLQWTPKIASGNPYKQTD